MERPGASAPPAMLTRYSLLGLTVLGTTSNNIISVPLHAIADDFDQPISAVVLSVSAFILVFAVAMPLSGWVGDRFGQKPTLIAALFVLAIAQLAAAAAPNLECLIAVRALQGLACSTVPPLVMSMLAVLYPGQRLQMMGAWAAANGVGYAIGPPMGGVLDDLTGWRLTFVLLAACSLLCLLAVWRWVPATRGRHGQLPVGGALLLAGGMALILITLSVLGVHGIPSWLKAIVALAGVMLMIGFFLFSADNPHAFIPPALFFESGYLHSCVAAFAQMFTFGAVLVVVPLYLTGPLDLSSSHAGVIFFVMPATMVIVAPLVSRVSHRFGIRGVLCTGLAVVIAADVLAGSLTQLGQDRLWPIAGTIVVLGVGMAMVQTPAAAGVAGSPAGGHGASLGLFNMLRFSGSTAGTAWVSLVYPSGELFILFLGCVVAAVVALGATFLRDGEVATMPDTSVESSH